MKNYFSLRLGTILLGVFGFALALNAADAIPTGTLTIEHAWSRPTDSMAQTGAIYLVMKNTGSAADTLVSVSTAVAGMAELHTNVNDAGMMRMKHIEGIDIPAKGTATLKPGGNHIMLMDLKSQLKEGTTYPVTLTFKHTGQVTVQVQVERMDGKPVKSEPMEGMHGSMESMKH